jgi:hypothetical protein
METALKSAKSVAKCAMQHAIAYTLHYTEQIQAIVYGRLFPVICGEGQLAMMSGVSLLDCATERVQRYVGYISRVFMFTKHTW